VLGDPRVHLRAVEIQRAHVVDDGLDVVAGDVGLGVAHLADAGDDLLVDVGEVLDVADVAQPAEPPAHHVDVDPAARVAQVRGSEVVRPQ